jgi:hypothetical protein
VAPLFAGTGVFTSPKVSIVGWIEMDTSCCSRPQLRIAKRHGIKTKTNARFIVHNSIKVLITNDKSGANLADVFSKCKMKAEENLLSEFI